tara:strand:+ start:630 stop:947 length:318 start_codon:yes stop_codon:yes gene_type:complete
MRSSRAKRKDANHQQIKTHFESLGCHVFDISNLDNCCDLVVSKHLVSVFVEVKDGKKPPSQRKLTEGERVFCYNIYQKAHWRLCESIDDANRIYTELFKPEVKDD